MKTIHAIARLFSIKKNRKEAMIAGGVTLAIVIVSIGGCAVAQQTSGVTLSVTVNTALSFTTLTNNFSTIQPGTPQFATTTLTVGTNDTAGYNVTLYGSNKTTSNNNLQLAANAASIPDQVEWVPGAATTTGGTAVRISAFGSANELAFRLMSASSTNGAPLLATGWWGTVDDYVDNANTKWAGIASSTTQRAIGNAGAGSYSATNHINSVVYYLNVATTQQTGAYSAPLTYTATGN